MGATIFGELDGETPTEQGSGEVEAGFSAEAVSQIWNSSSSKPRQVGCSSLHPRKRENPSRSAWD